MDPLPPRLRRDVVSFVRRSTRMNESQQKAWERLGGRFVIEVERGEMSTSVADGARIDWDEAFGRTAPLIVEIGSGVGEATAALAAARPSYDVLALEVWRPGVAATLERLAEAGAGNVRLCSVDAVWFLEHVIPADGLAGLWTFFPDPWPKTKHHKRRLVTASFASLAASRLAVGAEWRLATDWGHYADQMAEVLDAEHRLEGGVVARWAERPVTKFERKGIAAGRSITDLRYVRRG
ncbi:MAG: tRNA (guanosine(46)-N7)-methyltransferase TrmB [Nocardioidaceae bacterium]|nr:tRNA (guanosine(46)-N7)-methyltransferase TrmB [Nocardioidaceae bacterium]